MKYFEDDSVMISEEVRNMPIEQVKAELRAYEEEMRLKKLRQNQKKVSA
ncbi:MAG: hypothetical protein LBM59_00015 [Ruminococcus sp.]|jgi:hypothetical protein|nr:hypothetical protein [Ruminococcus sp.]